MVIGVCTLELHLPGVRSLKQKRSILKSMIARVHREFHVSIAEVGLQDVWQSATLGISVTSNSSAHAENVLERVTYWIERNRPDVEIVIHHIEILHV